MKKKKYIREGGICQFWDNWAEDGQIDYQNLMNAINGRPYREVNPEKRSTESYIVEKTITSQEIIKTEEEKENIPFNREYKNYDTEN
jgi:hypothetical protein